MTAKVRVERIEDMEGDGFCGACQREGLRWVVVLSDGSRVGIECAKAVLGYRPAPNSYRWVSDFTFTGQIVTACETFGWWVSKDGRAGAVTINGYRHLTGPVEWAKGEFSRLSK